MEALFEKKKRSSSPSEFLNVDGIEYFLFEEDFMENNIRCIPMVIRFKLDKVGIKLKLSEWNRFPTEERIQLAVLKCNSDEETSQYKTFLNKLIKEHTGREASIVEVDRSPLWKVRESLPHIVSMKLAEFNWQLSVGQWRNLTDLQRFALLKLCRPGHENENFPKAIREFNLVS